MKNFEKVSHETFLRNWDAEIGTSLILMKRKRKLNKNPIASGIKSDIIKENLPLPTVHYPYIYGTFFGFSTNINSEVYLCSCSKQAVINYIKLHNKTNSDRKLDKLYFPDSIIGKLPKNNEDIINCLKFKNAICHRCNLTKPSLRYCHEMYGGEFIQGYGFYMNQMYLTLGILPRSHHPPFLYLEGVCPEDIKNDIENYRTILNEFKIENEKIQNLIRSPKRSDISDDEITFMHNVKISESKRYVELDKLRRKRERTITIKIENIIRKEFGFKKVGEGWISESIILSIIKKLYPDSEIIHHYRPDWLERMEIDIFIPDLNIGIEYQGQQHFHSIKYWGGDKALEELKIRDKKKSTICKRKGIKLIKIKYTEPLTEEYIRDRINDLNIY